MSKTTPAIEIENLSFSYNGRYVLKDINLKLKKGDFTAFIGPNGGGKTTLLKLMLGLLRPDSGTIKILGKNPKKVACRLGYMPQDISINKEFPISVMDVVMMGRLKFSKRWPKYSKNDRKIAENMLKNVGMWEYKNRKIAELSGGQRQRVFMARALATEPEILFLDEPTASVDTTHQQDFYSLLKKLNKNMTIIIVNHDLMVISTYVKSVACINRGLHYHGGPQITNDMISMYKCPVELVTHGSIPHRVLKNHKD